MTRFVDSLERELVDAAERLARAPDGRRPRIPTARRLGPPLALAATLIAALALAAAVPVVLLGGGGGRTERLAAPPPQLQGTFSRTGPPADGRTEPPRASLNLTRSRYKLSAGIYGLLGEVRANDNTVQFRSATGYFKLPTHAGARRPSPDPAGRCPGARGIYRWSRAGDVLTFVLIRDPCPGRRIQLASSTWTTRP